MNLSDTARLIWAESLALPDLVQVARYVYGESSAGRQVPHATLRWMQREAGLGGVYGALAQKYGLGTVKDLILALEGEIGQQALAGSR
jgi:hypothetical protein